MPRPSERLAPTGNPAGLQVVGAGNCAGSIKETTNAQKSCNHRGYADCCHADR